MEWIIVLCLLLSIINLYFLLKYIIQRNFNSELQEFRTYTESLITEFNRITTRNVDLLDSRIEELDHKIRIAQKIDHVLKEDFEEVHKIKHFSTCQLNQIYQDSIIPKLYQNNNTKLESTIPSDTKSTLLESTEHITSYDIPIIETQNIIHQSIEFQTKNDHFEIPSDIIEKDHTKDICESKIEHSLFEGIPIPKLKQYKKKSLVNKQNKEATLIQYIKENKSKEQLLDLGFTSNEINLAYLYYTHKTE